MAAGEARMVAVEVRTAVVRIAGVEVRIVAEVVADLTVAVEAAGRTAAVVVAPTAVAAGLTAKLS
jgi:hypothetical protein